jgi:hypothetical protein
MSNIFLKKQKIINPFSKNKTIVLKEELNNYGYTRHFPPANLE